MHGVSLRRATTEGNRGMWSQYGEGLAGCRPGVSNHGGMHECKVLCIYVDRKKKSRIKRI